MTLPRRAAGTGPQALPQEIGVYEIFKELLAVQRPHGDALEIGTVQSVITRDVELLEIEAELGPQVAQGDEGVVAKVTVRRGVDSKSRHR